MPLFHTGLLQTKVEVAFVILGRETLTGLVLGLQHILPSVQNTHRFLSFLRAVVRVIVFSVYFC